VTRTTTRTREPTTPHSAQPSWPRGRPLEKMSPIQNRKIPQLPRPIQAKRRPPKSDAPWSHEPRAGSAGLPARRAGTPIEMRRTGGRRSGSGSVEPPFASRRGQESESVRPSQTFEILNLTRNGKVTGVICKTGPPAHQPNPTKSNQIQPENGNHMAYPGHIRPSCMAMANINSNEVALCFFAGNFYPAANK
jgi:hypothetical protein